MKLIAVLVYLSSALVGCVLTTTAIFHWQTKVDLFLDALANYSAGLLKK